MRTTTVTITCDGCGTVTTKAYHEADELDVTSTVATMYVGIRRDLCPACMVKAHQARIDAILKETR